MTEYRLNIADRLRHSAALVPGQRAVVFPESRDAAGRVAWTHVTFRELDDEVDAIARGLMSLGVRTGHRLVLMVRPSIEFIALTFGIMRSGACCTLIDPGMGKRSVLRCVDVVDPDGFVAISPVQLIRRLMPWRFRNSRFNMIVGPRKRRFGCPSYRELVEFGRKLTIPFPQTQKTDSAAIIFTSGSTGPPKGVHYEHGMFDAQVDLIRDQYQIQPGEIDLPGFPLFSLFNLAMQVTSVIPDMDPTRPAQVNPERIIEAIRSQNVTQAYGSPALWNRVGRFCEEQRITLPGLRRILSAGAPVPNHVLSRMTKALCPSAEFFTPYGATECLPVSSISAREVLQETAALTAQGKGTCVGRVFDQMRVRIIETSDQPFRDIGQTVCLPNGEIGEIIVSGPVATREYFHRPDATEMAKIQDSDTFWHRMGDVGYFDESGRLWFCGRKAHIVTTTAGPMHSVCCEAIFNNHPDIYRSALVGLGTKGRQVPVIVAEPETGRFPTTDADRSQLSAELLELGSENLLTSGITRILFHRSLPVDTRHNVKINREQLAEWAATQRSVE
ncbi:MAG TPA: fatty acid CoA ligase family protein [Planctomycetaceae bacterium]|nr:fatty acid CoA ligase family protein [Planctomycetaceae bacterium]HQZ66344.1 fatty acid CoA ligase family protein [Planctomycetaceae bacterium]